VGEACAGETIDNIVRFRRIGINYKAALVEWNSYVFLARKDYRLDEYRLLKKRLNYAAAS
jgi:hypothetical protein